MAHHALFGAPRNRGQIAQQLRRRPAWPRHRDSGQGLQGIEMVLGHLRRHLIAHAVGRIQKKRGRGLKTPAQGDQQAGRHIPLGESDLLHFRAVRLHLQARQIEHLLDMHVHRAGNVAKLIGDFVGDVVIRLLVPADDLDVNGRGQPEVQDLADDVGRLKKEGDAREMPDSDRGGVFECSLRWDGDFPD